MRTLLVFLVALSVCIAQVLSQNIEGFPPQVCGSQSFQTTYPVASGDSITLAVSTSSNIATVTPSSVTYTATNSPTVSVNCQSLGPVEISFTSTGRNIKENVRFCQQ